ncbi:MAG: fibronectin type III domain-containing protein [Kiritimatiellae bacterium]|nr:fibronectin type III domain-containing protein [Kiritimatiellia bacterium]
MQRRMSQRRIMPVLASFSLHGAVLFGPAVPACAGVFNMTAWRQTPAVAWIDSAGPLYSLNYTFEGQPGVKVTAFAYYGVPDNCTGRIPGIVLVHGGGGEAFPDWVTQWRNKGYAAFAMTQPGGSGYDGYVNNVGSIASAVSFLCARPEVDPDRIALFGISWGGYYTSTTVGLDDRLAAAVAVYGCGYIYENSSWSSALGGDTYYIDTIDPKNCLPNADLPMLWLTGNTDPHYPLNIHRKSYRLTQGKNTIITKVNYPHGHSPPWNTPEIGRYVDSHLLNATPLPEFRSWTWSTNRISATYSSPSGAQSAKLVYTRMNAPWSDWRNMTWYTTAAQIDAGAGTIRADLPAGAKVFYLNLTDSNGHEVSTEHVDIALDGASGSVARGAPAPRAPSDLTARPVATGRIDLSWTDNSDNETGFKIDRRRSGFTDWVRVATPGANATNRVDTDMEAETRYYYKVKAYNANGNSPYSNVADATTLACAAPAEILAKGGVWRYRAGTAEASAPAHAWRSRQFDDSDWAAGATPIGYAYAAATPLPDMSGSYVSVMLRREFQTPDPAAVGAVHLDVDYDDGFIAWINGEEVARVNVAGDRGSFVACDQPCSGYVTNPCANWTGTLTGAALPMLHANNAFAVQLFNNSLGSGDCLIDAAISVTPWSMAPNDADGDGMADDYETACLGGDGEPDADPDADGLANLAEYIAGTDPRQRESRFAVDVGLAAGVIEVSFRTVAAGGTGYAGLTRHYALEARNETGSWLPVGAGYADIVGTGGLIRFTHSPAARTGCYRARVWLSESE